MAKYHINQATGNVAPCNASTRPCPHGGEENHFGSEAEARKVFEERNSTEALKPVVKRPGVRLERRAEKYPAPKTWADVPAKADDEAIKNALAYAVVNNRAAVITYEATENSGDFENLSDYDGSDYMVTGTKSYLIATANGGLAKVTYTADVDAQMDGYWEFHPDINAKYSYYDDLESFKANTQSGAPGNVEVASDSVFREETYYNGRSSGSRPSYDHSNSREAIDASKRALRELPKPYDVSKLADLHNYKGKIPAATLEGKGYFQHEDPKVRAAVVGRKELPSSLQDAALKDPAQAVRVALAAREDLDRPTMEVLMDDTEKPAWNGGSRVTPRLAVLKNPKLPVRLQNKALKEGSIEDMQALAKNSGLTDSNREKLEAKAAQLGFRI